MLKISKSLLLNFLEFVGILSIAPEQYQAKVDDLRNLFINAHHLLNLYRPHQARESLILMMEEQLDRSREDIRQMDKVKAEAEAALEQIRVEGLDAESARDQARRLFAQQSADESGVSAEEDSRMIWDLLDRED